MTALGVVLLLAAMGLGVLGLIRRGYELLVVIAMVVLSLSGLLAMVKGVLG